MNQAEDVAWLKAEVERVAARKRRGFVVAGRRYRIRWRFLNRGRLPRVEAARFPEGSFYQALAWRFMLTVLVNREEATDGR